MTGKVKKFSKEKGYGFITKDDGTDVFFHYSQIIMPNGETYREIDEGAMCEFDEVSTERGPQAHNVRKILSEEPTEAAPVEEPAAEEVVVEEAAEEVPTEE